MSYCVINLEDGMPSVQDALYDLRQQLDMYRKSGNRVFVIIHGYGSHGVGGKIGIKTREWLAAQKRKNACRTVVYGEEFGMFDDDSRRLKNKHPDLLKYYNRGNDGITIVEF